LDNNRSLAAGARRGRQGQAIEVNMPPLALDDTALAEVMTAARSVPIEHRNTFLERVAQELSGQEIGPRKPKRIGAARPNQNFPAWGGSSGGETVSERARSAQRLEIGHDVLDFARREPKQRHHWMDSLG
jgi:hypothetical protein